mgnify:CR=1 FL=1
MRHEILPNKLLWYIAVANVFVYLLRYGILDWSPTYLKEVKHFALDKSSWAYFLYEYAGIPGTLLCGWMSDKVFKGNRGATGVFFMTLVTIATVVYWLNPPGNPGVDMACMIIIGSERWRRSPAWKSRHPMRPCHPSSRRIFS